MSEDKGKLCSCGFPQSKPIPHEHDQTVREKAIMKHFENRMRDLVKQRKDLLTACGLSKKIIGSLPVTGTTLTRGENLLSCLESINAAIAKAEPSKPELEAADE